MPPTEGVKIWLTPWGIIHHESCLWHLGSNRALELVKTFHLYRYGSLRKKHQWRDRLVAVGIYPSHTGCFGLPDLQYYISILQNVINFCDVFFFGICFFLLKFFGCGPLYGPFDDRGLVGFFGWWKRWGEAVMVEQCSRS